MTEAGWRPTLGAIVHSGGASFLLWAPKPQDVRLLVQDASGQREVPARQDGEYWSARLEGAGAGTRYGYLVDGEGPFPDPCSRSQPDGPHGLSEVVDPSSFSWSDGGWDPPPFTELVIYECHIGTFTSGGTFASAIGDFKRLARLGVNAIELMPVATFPGRWNWGYEGVAPFAPAAVYGGPDGLRRFVDAAHGAGLAVILDVVYNHFGPDGNYTGVYSDAYTTPSHRTPWGEAINFDGPGSAHVRRFVVENLRHWVREYHIDGFRLDATHSILDRSREHILAEVSHSLEGFGPGGRRPYLVAESHENEVRYLRARAEGGYGFDAVWADDFHHAVRALIAGDNEGYFRGFDGSASTVARTIAQGFYFEGQHDPGFGAVRGTPARDAPWGSFVYCLENHDQVGNRAFGERLCHDARRGDVLAATMLLLLLPQTPLLFQGQEWLPSTPFQFFTDHRPELGRLVTEGRRREFRAFRSFADPELRMRIPDPQQPATFGRSRLRRSEGRHGRGALATNLHRALLCLRRSDPVLRAYRASRLPLDARPEGRAVTVRFGCQEGERLVIANFGETATFQVGDGWLVLLGTDEPRFGGSGRLVEPNQGGVLVPGHTAAYLTR